MSAASVEYSIRLYYSDCLFSISIIILSIIYYCTSKVSKSKGKLILTSFQEHFKWSGRQVGVGCAGDELVGPVEVCGLPLPRLGSATAYARLPVVVSTVG